YQPASGGEKPVAQEEDEMSWPAIIFILIILYIIYRKTRGRGSSGRGPGGSGGGGYYGGGG
ncbi:MAG TPA: hypothetical protein DDZ44_03905, partial [Syntrophomonas wolfei]|nr:hypothetical protein [Syntrophomonas wolfei]